LVVIVSGPRDSVGYRSSIIYVDESGLALQSPYFVVGALKFRGDHGLVANQLDYLRSRANWRAEAHFVNITRTTVHLYQEAARIVAKSEARFRCLVINVNDYPLSLFGTAWVGRAQLAIRALTAVIWREDLASALLDNVSVPLKVNFEEYVRKAVNQQLGRNALVTVSRMSSKACWGLQLADLMTGAVAHQYRQTVDSSAKSGSPKGRVAAAVAEAYNLRSLKRAGSHKLKVIEFRPGRPHNQLELQLAGAQIAGSRA
jgi:hypothetical protein